MKQTAHKIWQILSWVFFVLVIILAVVVFLNRTIVTDWLHGLSYQPSAEMSNIRDELALTERGTLLFNALSPTLNEATEFNQNCRDDISEVAVLGCYGAGKIYVYNITAPEFAGIREVTTAHELLHAVWGRLSDDQRQALQTELNEVLAAHQDPLAEELGAYNTDEQTEELYVRAGTEIRDLPTVLSDHYAEIFRNRAQIVDFYDNYIAVFREAKARADQLEQEITALGTTIESETASYEAESNALSQDIADFNACASRSRCFTSESAFQAQRSQLLARQQALLEMNQSINDQITTYNTKIDEYNQNAARSQELQAKINSTATPDINL